jgi:hypothetical protein
MLYIFRFCVGNLICGGNMSRESVVISGTSAAICICLEISYNMFWTCLVNFSEWGHLVIQMNSTAGGVGGMARVGCQSKFRVMNTDN